MAHLPDVKLNEHERNTRIGQGYSHVLTYFYAYNNNVLDAALVYVLLSFFIYWFIIIFCYNFQTNLLTLLEIGRVESIHPNVRFFPWFANDSQFFHEFYHIAPSYVYIEFSFD